MKRIKDKIAKLMALSESANEHEAENALRKAIALMQKYQLDHADINQPEIVTEWKVHTHVKLNVPYLRLIHNITARCGVYFVYRQGSYDFKADLIFSGTPGDIETAWYFYETARAQIDAKTNLWKKQHGHGAKEGNAYKLGLVRGYSARFARMMERATEDAKEAGSALVPVDTRIEKASAVYCKEWGEPETKNRKGTYNADGVRDSENLKINHGVKGDKAPLAIGRKY